MLVALLQALFSASRAFCVSPIARRHPAFGATLLTALCGHRLSLCLSSHLATGFALAAGSSPNNALISTLACGLDDVALPVYMDLI